MQDSNNAETTLMRVIYDEHAAALWRYAVRLTGDRSARAWLFTVARNMVIDDEVNTALDRLLLGDALAQLSADHHAVIRRAYYLGWTTAQIAEDLGIAEGTTGAPTSP